MARRMRGIPPLEVMGRRTAVTQSAARPVIEPDTVEGQTESVGITSPGADWWTQTKHPMVLRVPRGLVVVAIVGFIGLLTLAYWVGHSRGDAAATRDMQTAMVVGGPRAGLPPRPGAGDQGSSAATEVDHQWVDLDVHPLGIDTREPGLNYFVLARYDRESAERLVRFLQDNGVEACAIPVHNTRLFHVVDLMGIPSNEVSRGMGQDRRAMLLRLGQQWRQRERGPSDLADAWPQLHRE